MLDETDQSKVPHHLIESNNEHTHSTPTPTEIRPKSEPVPIKPAFKAEKLSSHQWRHFKALMWKNGVNAKRTWFGSILEIICPILLMFIIVWARTAIDIVDAPEFDIWQLKKPIYPTAMLNEEDEWTTQNFDITKQGAEMIPFLEFANYTTAIPVPGIGTLYSPLLDPIGPLYFFPQHCYERRNRYNSPIVAYIPQGNQIEADMIQQLELLFTKQRWLYEYTQELIGALEDPLSSESIAIVMVLIEGGTLQEQIDLLNEFGAPAPFVTLLQFLALSDTASGLSPESAVQLVSDAVSVINTQVTQINAMIAQQANATNALINTLTVSDMATVIGLDANQTQLLLNSVSEFLVPNNGTGTALQEFSQQMTLNQTQQEELFALITQLNETQNSQVNLPTAALQALVGGNITLNEFTQQLNATIDVVGQQIGLNPEQMTQVTGAVDQIQNAALFQQVMVAAGNQTSLAQVSQAFGVTQAQIDLLTLAAATELPFTPELTGQILSLDPTSQLLLLSVLSNENEDEVTALVDSVALAFELTPEQTQVTQAIFQQALDAPLEIATDQNSTSYQFFALVSSGQPLPVSMLDPILATNLTTILQNIAPGASPVDSLLSLAPTDIEVLADALNLDEDTIALVYAVTGPLNITAVAVGPQIAETSASGQVVANETTLEKILKQANAKQFGKFRLQAFASHAELDAYIEHEEYGRDDEREGICFGFNIIEHADNDYELELMFNDLWPSRIRSIPSQRIPAASPTVQIPLVREYGYYMLNGYANMQNWVANTILRRKTINSAQIVNMITPAKNQTVQIDGLTVLLQLCMTLFILLMYIPVMYRTVYRIVFEKVTKAKESMRIMGMTDLPYWLSWWCNYTIVNTAIATGAWGVLMYNIFEWHSAFLLWATIWLFGQSLFGLILITQALFQTPRAAAITCTVVYFGITILGTFIDAEDTPYWTKFAVCLFLPQIAMLQTVQVYVSFVTANIPMNFSTWHLEFEQFSVSEGLFLIFMGGVLMILLGLYLENVLPKTYGARKHPLFCLKCNSCKSSQKTFNNRPAPDNDIEFETRYLKPECFEPAPHEIRSKEMSNEILKVANLKKQYENGFKAVNGMNIKMYADQIFVLLGHNGAGKTTTISMLTGLLGATEGSAEVFGVDMFENMNDVRRFMGVCPQHDVLFELLTVEEHLSFFYDLKGADPDSKTKQAEITALMKDSGVYDKRDALAYQLSGGNKRKLSVAIALCGNSKFVLLDEPTSGMDLQARRQLWNMLKQYKKNRIILLTTHYMDEADILGDRIGIMAKGKMTCLGSSIFLKSKFGVGYNLTVVKTCNEPNEALMNFLQQNLGPDVHLQSEIQTEMTIQIPLAYSTKFAEFFEEFDNALESLNIQSYGISISTLEEVFLKIGHMDDPIANPESGTSLGNEVVPGEVVNTDLNRPSVLGLTKEEKSPDSVETAVVSEFNLKDNQKQLDTSFWNGFVAVLFKRMMNYRRNKKAIFNEVVVPALIVLVGFSINKMSPAWRADSRIQTLERLPQPQYLLFNEVPVVGNLNISLLADALPQPGDSEFIIQPFNGDQSNMMAFGDAMFDLGQQFDVPPYMYGAYQIYEADRDTQQYKVMSYVNLTSQDASGLYPQFIYESILKVATNDPDFKFKLRSTPYPPTYEFKYRMETVSAGIIIFVTAIAYSVMITTVVSYLVTERIEGLKHLQEISGMQLKAYWVGNFCVDFIKMQLTIAMTLILFEVFDMGITTAWVTYLVFPFGALPFTYITSFLFTADSAAQTFTMFFHFFTFSILSTVAFALRLAPNLEKVGDDLNQGLKAIPTYPVSASVYCDTSCSVLAQLRERSIDGTGGGLSADVWHISNNLGDVIAPFVHLIVWAFILMLIEKNFFKWMIIGPNKRLTSEAVTLDSDVQKEADRVRKDDDEHQIQVSNLKKVYHIKSKKCLKQDSLIAVSNLSFSLEAGECFALLGVNGAGKSTTFKSLTCEVKPTSGKIKIAGFDVSKQFEKARKLIGYCPQPNLIFETMSVEEHIYYYARIKGIPRKHRTQEVEKAIAQLGLEDHRKKPAGTLSGGNKRKVCVALALVGSPPIILLDEPSAGMDPEARRFMWSVVAKIAQNKTSAVVLTTHSMEEAEALSTKMGIMVKGGIFKCFGSAQHIKDKFGTGYVIELKIRSVEQKELWDLVKHHYDSNGNLKLAETTKLDDTVIKQIESRLVGQDIHQCYREVHSQTNLYESIASLCTTFDEVELIEHYGNYMRLRVQRLDKSIGSVFGLVEQFKVRHDVVSYSVSQTTLEQIFQGFADTSFNENSIKLQLMKAPIQEMEMDTEQQGYYRLAIVE